MGGGAKPQRSLTPTNRRTRQITVSVSWDDEREIKRRAARNGLSLSSYLRDCALGGKHNSPCLDEDCAGILTIREDGVFCITCLRQFFGAVDG